MTELITPRPCTPALPSRSVLTTLVGKTFTTTAHGREVRLRLTAVRDAPQRPSGLSQARLSAWRRSAFVVEFCADAGLDEGVHVLSRGPAMELELVLEPEFRSIGSTRMTGVVTRGRL